jgi:excisionase family DNA binding protein
MFNSPNPLTGRKEVYLTLSEAAEYLRVSRRTIYRWLDLGYLQRFRLGNVSRIELSELDRFVAQFTESLEVEDASDAPNA